MQNGLAFRLYVPRNPAMTGCYLNGTVARATPWCKLLAVKYTLQHFESVVIWIDSDAWLRPTFGDETLAKVVQDFKSSNECGWFSQDLPFSSTRANTGFWMWRQSNICLGLLARWWNINIKSQKKYYEQDALNGYLLNSVKVLNNMTPMLDQSDTQRNVIHVSHAHYSSRWQRVCKDAVESHIPVADMVPKTIHTLSTEILMDS